MYTMYAMWCQTDKLKTKEEARALLDRVLAAQVTDIFLATASREGAHYQNSTLLPKAWWLREVTFDPLAYMLANFPRVHAWVMVHRVPLAAHPDWSIQKTRGVSADIEECVDFTKPEVSTWLGNLVSELWMLYPGMAGIHHDYCYVPWVYGDGALSFFKPEHVTNAVAAMAAAINGRGVTSCFCSCDLKEGTSACCADWRAWMEKGYIQMLCPDFYVKDLPELYSNFARLEAAPAQPKDVIAPGLSECWYTYPDEIAHHRTPQQLQELITATVKRGYNVAFFDSTPAVTSDASIAVIAANAPTTTPTPPPVTPPPTPTDPDPHLATMKAAAAAIRVQSSAITAQIAAINVTAIKCGRLYKTLLASTSKITAGVTAVNAVAATLEQAK